MALKPYTVEFKANLSHTVWLDAGLTPYCMLKKMTVTVKYDVFENYFAVSP